MVMINYLNKLNHTETHLFIITP